MTQKTPIDTEEMAQEAKASKHKETYRLIEKNTSYRIGVGARTDSSNTPSFFVEVVFNSSTKKEGIDITKLEKILKCLKGLKSKGYSIVHEDSDCFSCEKTVEPNNIDKEYLAVLTIAKTALP